MEVEAVHNASNTHTRSDSQHASQLSHSSYVLRELINDVPVTGDGGEKGNITCVDVWNGNLYIGTSLGDVLHYVAIPPDPSDDSDEPIYIFATKLQPPYNAQQTDSEAGVKRILVLPDVSKACILCNGTLTFYTLPELSPAFGGKIKQSGCLWVGGVDRNEVIGQGSLATGTIILLGLRQCLRLIRISDNASKIRDIQLKSISMVQRRGDLACVADDHAYALLDVVNQRKNELFPLSSLSDTEARPSQLEIPRSEDRRSSRGLESISPQRRGDGHERNVSTVSNISTYSIKSASDNDSTKPQDSAQKEEEAEPPISHAATLEIPKTSIDSVREPVVVHLPLMPNILSPTPREFLLTTGSTLNEPGVGMFVNEEGDVMREPLEFSTYPESLVLEQPGSGLDQSVDDGDSRVLALVRRPTSHGIQQAIEIQSWAAEIGQARKVKEYLPLDPDTTGILDADGRSKAGLTVVTSATDVTMDTISNRLRQRQLQITPHAAIPTVVSRRNAEEDKFVARFAKVHASVLLYCPDRVFWVNRQPLLLRLEHLLNNTTVILDDIITSIDVSAIQKVLTNLGRVEAQNELEFLTLTYVRQKASLLLLGNIILKTRLAGSVSDQERQAADRALKIGEIDPRAVLYLVPALHGEIDGGENGVWISQGLIDCAILVKQEEVTDSAQGLDVTAETCIPLLKLIKNYLMTWRAKKGFGSVADEKQVFCSVDAGLLHILLILDSRSPRGPAPTASIRAELNDIVDKGLECFDRAIELFERYKRLYILSRLYQSRKQPAKVLETWCRILDGEPDVGGELIDGEHDLRKYLSKIRDRDLVIKYGTWLARRNSKLGVQIFADENSRVKFAPADAVAVLQEHAPGSVKEFLEYLVFTKRQPQYGNELIAYYLDTVLEELDRSAESKAALIYSYETYRALKPPKPTYRQFITENALDAEWWRNRLRLLQLIGGGHESGNAYDSKRLRDRLAPYSNELVPEMIILDGREGNHDEALSLLTHGLGDYDTAIRYCLHGGSGLFHPSFGSSENSRPTHEHQAELFEHLLHQFFAIRDPEERLERACELLERFARFYDIEKVLELIPDTWTIEVVAGFLVHSFRELTQERNETTIVKALSGAQNLRRAVEMIEKIEELGPTVVEEEAGVE